MRLALLASALAAVASSAHAQAPADTTASLLDPMFQDHAVLQRGRPVAVWGRAAPGAAVSVEVAQAQAQAVAGADGAWRVDLPALAPGGPHVLTVRAGAATQTVSDVMVGDVWLCSGQSNMEYMLRQVTNADTEVASARDENLRLFLVGRSSRPEPATAPAAVGAWRTTTPESAREFSAACYFMGRDLKRAERVPVGLIAASWGGSIIEDWLSPEAVRSLGGYEASLEMLAAYARSPAEGEAMWREMAQAWWRDEPGMRRGWNATAAVAGDWAPIPAEGFWETTAPGLTTFDGVVWLRKEFELTAAQARQAATLELGPVDDLDHTWVNGRHVGGREGWNTPRAYALSEGTLKAGRNVLAVGVLDTGGGGGAWGPATDKRLVLADGSVVPLREGWVHRVSSPLAGLPTPPRTPWMGGSGVTTLYNGMIDPLGPYGLKGVAWYQGEANAGDAAGYAKLLPALFADWRDRFENPELRMLVVQLANFGPAAERPTNSSWAALRETQRRVVGADPHAGLAVAIDIGDRYDIHPTNKQEVGRRLALAALRLEGRDAPTSLSPQAVTRAADGAVRVAYGRDAGLILFGAHRPVGFEVCDAEGVCRFVDASLQGDDLVLASTTASDVKVRFCWADSPVCNLYGPGGLPAAPFEMEIS
jgi:sialate O-acetylesterase